MKAQDSKKTSQVTDDGYAYLKKRVLVRKARSAGKVAAQNAMELMGYVVTVRDGWVIRLFREGRVEQIERLATA